MDKSLYFNIRGIIARRDVRLESTHNGWCVRSADGSSELLRVDNVVETIGNPNSFNGYQPYGTVHTVNIYMMGLYITSDTRYFVSVPASGGAYNVSEKTLSPYTKQLLGELKARVAVENTKTMVANVVADKSKRPHIK